MRTVVALVLLAGVCSIASSSIAATGTPAARALAHLQAFDESLANLQVDLTAPVVVSTTAETRQRLNGLGSLIGETLPSIRTGFPAVSSASMLGQVRKIRSALAAASSASGVAQVRALTGIAAAEAPLEADVEVAAEAPSGREPLALVRGATDFGVQALNTLTIRTARFENATGSPLAISSAQIPAGVFSVVTDGCGGKTLAPLATCAVTIEFGPVSAVASIATLVVKDNATAMPEQDYLLTGAGVANGNAQVVVKTGSSASALPPGSPVTFPEQTALSSFATAGERLQAIQLVNVGTTSAILDDVGIGGPDADDFILTHGQGTHGCEDATLAPGAPGQVSTANECYVSVEVKAGRYTRPLHASLDVTGTHTGGLASIPLGLTQADLSLDSVMAAKAAGQVTYRFGIANTGPDPAERTEVDARVTASSGSLRLLSSVPEGCAYGSGSGILTCAVGTLPAHAKAIVTVVFRASRADGQITNLSTVQSLDFDPTPRNDVKTLVTAAK